MDKKIIEPFRKLVGEGEKVAPLKSIKLKAKFQKAEGKKKELAKKMK